MQTRTAMSMISKDHLLNLNFYNYQSTSAQLHQESSFRKLLQSFTADANTRMSDWAKLGMQY